MGKPLLLNAESFGIHLFVFFVFFNFYDLEIFLKKVLNKKNENIYFFFQKKSSSTKIKKTSSLSNKKEG